MNYNKSGLIVLLVSVFFSFIWFVYLVLFSTPMNLAELEKESTLPINTSAGEANISQVKEPWISSELLITHGSRVYQTYCAPAMERQGWAMV